MPTTSAAPAFRLLSRASVQAVRRGELQSFPSAFLAETEIHVMMFGNEDFAQSPRARERDHRLQPAARIQTGEIFFTFLARNSLKRLDLKK
jgi:hypothetical protein